MIPQMDDMLFVVFSLMMFEELGDIVTRRRIVAMKKFAEAVRVFDLINTWHTRGARGRVRLRPRDRGSCTTHRRRT